MLFLAAAAYFYFSPPLNPFKLLASYSAAIFLGFFPPQIIPPIATAALLGLCAFVILGIKNLVIINRSSAYYLLNAVLFWLVFSSIFGAIFQSGSSPYALFVYAVGGAFIFFILRESFSLPVSAVFAFLVAQIVWVISLLPLGPFNSAALALVFTLVLEDIGAQAICKTPPKNFFLKELTLFTALLMLIFVFS